MRNALGYGFDYLGSLVYQTDALGTRLESAAFAGGRILRMEYASRLGPEIVYIPQYHLTDHLGSTRVVVNRDNVIQTRNDYYPFGGRWNGDGEAATNRWQFNGKESQQDFGLHFLDYGARMYDSGDGRWLTQDPLAEKYYSVSPYAFCAGDPVNRIDPNGMDWYSYMKYEYDEDGNLSGGRQVYEYTEAHSQHALNKTGVTGTYEGEVVVVFNGSLNECLGINKNDSKCLYINGLHAITAQVTVYGSGGPDDIAEYTGFTMSSDFEKYGAIADGKYNVNYVVPGKREPLSSNYAVNNCGPVNCLNGVNPSPIDPYSSTQKDGIYIHSTNRNGKAGGDISASTGCLLIQGGNQWKSFKDQIGPRDFRLILNRK